MIMFQTVFVCTVFLILLHDAHPYRKSKRAATIVAKLILNSIAHELNGAHHAYDKKPGEIFLLNCKNTATTKIKEEYPFAEFRWMHNDEVFKIQPVRMEYGTENIKITNSIPQDSGTYHCVVKVAPDVSLVASLCTVVVGRLEVRISSGNNLDLKCNSKIFGELFKESIRIWINPKGKPVRSKSAKENVETFSSIDATSSGDWTCYVKDKKTGRMWTTAKYTIEIVPVHSLSQRIHIYIKANKAKSVAILIISVFAIINVANLLIRLLERKQKNFAKEIEEMQQALGFDITDLQAEPDDENSTSDDQTDPEAAPLLENEAGSHETGRDESPV